MTNPFAEDSIFGYNSNPPPNDQSETVENTVDWGAQIIAKVGDPLKNYAQANFANVSSAFTQVLGGAGVTTVATSYAVLSSDRSKLVVVNGGSGVTITTPDATVEGQTFAFGVCNVSANAITFDGNGAQTINGSGSLTLEPTTACTVVTDGSNWYAYASPSDPSRTSIFLTAQAFEAGVADGNVVYWHDSNNEWTKAQAGITADVGLGIADVTNGYVFGPGLISMSFDQGALTEGADLYLSASTAGEITTTKPLRVVVLGRALSATTLWFNPFITDEIQNLDAQTLSGAVSYEWTGIPSTAKEINLAISEASLDGTDRIRIQLGSSAGYVATGYTGFMGRTGYGPTSNTTGFLMNVTGGASVSVLAHATLIHMGGNVWTCTVTGDTEAFIPAQGMGRITLPGTLDRIRVISVSGDLFDGGTATGRVLHIR